MNSDLQEECPPNASTRSSSILEVEGKGSHHGGPSPEETRKEPARFLNHPHFRSFVVVYTMIFFNGCCFTAVAPSVPFYLQDLNAPPSVLGWVVSLYSVGQIFGSPLAGWLSEHFSSKNILTISSALGLLSSIMYAVVPGYSFIMFSRMVTGISAGLEFTTELTFIANSTTVTERTAFLASVTACNVLGFIMGPALGFIVSSFDVHFLGIRIDKYTGPGWLLTAMFMVDLIMVRMIFESTAAEKIDGNGFDASKEEGLLTDDLHGDTSLRGMDEQKCHTDADEPHPSLFLVVSLIFVQFSLMSGFSLLETITSPLVQDQFEWTVQNSDFLFTCGGFFSLTLYVAFVTLSRKLQDRYLVLTALVLCTVGFLLAVDWKQLEWVPSWFSNLQPPYLFRFLLGFAFIYAGFMTGRSLLFALYSKVISQQHQGIYLGWMVAGGSAARALGPFVAVALYYRDNQAGEILLTLFGSLGLFHLVCVVLMFILWSSLSPEQQSAQRNNDTNQTREDKELV